MRYAYITIITIHGLIHLIGWFKSMGWAENSPISAPISKSVGGLWALAAILLVSYAVIYGLRMPASWMLGLAALLLSQTLIIMFWADARYGTIINVLLLIAVLFSYGEWQFQRQAKRVEMTLLNAAITPTLALSDTSHLPPPVKNWLARSGALKKPRMTHGEIRQRLQLKT